MATNESNVLVRLKSYQPEQKYSLNGYRPLGRRELTVGTFGDLPPLPVYVAEFKDYHSNTLDRLTRDWSALDLEVGETEAAYSTDCTVGEKFSQETDIEITSINTLIQNTPAQELEDTITKQLHEKISQLEAEPAIENTMEVTQRKHIEGKIEELNLDMSKDPAMFKDDITKKRNALTIRFARFGITLKPEITLAELHHGVAVPAIEDPSIKSQATSSNLLAWIPFLTGIIMSFTIARVFFGKTTFSTNNAFVFIFAAGIGVALSYAYELVTRLLLQYQADKYTEMLEEENIQAKPDRNSDVKNSFIYARAAAFSIIALMTGIEFLISLETFRYLGGVSESIVAGQRPGEFSTTSAVTGSISFTKIAFALISAILLFTYAIVTWNSENRHAMAQTKKKQTSFQKSHELCESKEYQDLLEEFSILLVDESNYSEAFQNYEKQRQALMVQMPDATARVTREIEQLTKQLEAHLGQLKQKQSETQDILDSYERKREFLIREKNTVMENISRHQNNRRDFLENRIQEFERTWRQFKRQSTPPINS